MNRRQRKKAERAAQVSAPAAVPHPAFRVTDEAVSAMRLDPKRTKSMEEIVRDNLRPYKPMKGVLPAGRRITMDGAFGGAIPQAMLENVNAAFQEGYAFPGFTVLANWAQITEFRKPAEIYAREMTRKWIKIQATGEKDKTDKIKVIEAELKRLNAQAKFRQAIEQDGLFGRSQIFIDFGDDFNKDSGELRTELVEKTEKIGKREIQRLTVIEPIWSYPNLYNADNPLDPTFYKPTSWFVMGKEIHSSRLLTIITRDIPDILKPAYAFSGLSLLQMMKPYVDNWLRTRQSVSDLIHSFTVWVLKTDMSTILQGGSAQNLFNRLMVFNQTRDNHGAMAIDKSAEEFENVSTNLGSLDKLQAQSQEQMCAPTGIPLVYLTGITPAGLNASSQDEIEVFQDTCMANQELYTPPLSKVINLIQLSKFGEIDPEIGFKWEPLKMVDREQEARIKKAQAEEDQIRIDSGILSAQEVRTRIAGEEDSPYSGIDVDDVPTPPEQEPGSEMDVKDLADQSSDT